jgi:hypothetical protein
MFVLALSILCVAAYGIANFQAAKFGQASDFISSALLLAATLSLPACYVCCVSPPVLNIWGRCWFSLLLRCGASK